ncbi:hypothetical protein CFO_g4941 [Ceratocystis platani]|uniref:Uncharacterized protein n=1 Tax=Ceratocystis fimbriata f. sp. platani TaxID=88771 RepID=A0A0F8CPR3_CERFI|nr:hypothetical protein CFO_g4941 [Ceratocystis platani]
MRFLSVLPLALSFSGLCQALSIYESGYEVKSFKNQRAVVLHDYKTGYDTLIDLFHFGHDEFFINVVNNDVEPADKKLGLKAIYQEVFSREGRFPQEMNWMIFDVGKDPETKEAIAEIRRRRGVHRRKEVRIAPGEVGWDTILSTKYFGYLLDIDTRHPRKIVLSKKSFEYPDRILEIDTIHFGFESSDDWYTFFGYPTERLDAGDNQPLSDDEEGASLQALFMEEEELKFMDAMDADLVDEDDANP